MCTLPTSRILQKALVPVFLAIIPSAWAQQTTHSDTSIRKATLAQQSPCSRGMPRRMGPRTRGLDEGIDPSVRLDPSIEFAPLGMMELGADQRNQINSILFNACNRQFDLSGRVSESKMALHRLYAGDQRDAAAIDHEYKTLFALIQQIIETDIDTRGQILSVLKPEQRTTLENYHQGPLGFAPDRNPK